MTRVLAAAFFTAALLSGGAWAQTEQKASAPAMSIEEVSIPFANFGGIDDWRADGNKALYVKGRRSNEWYYAKLFSTCHGLNFANTIGFESTPPQDFNRYSTILVDGQRCALISLVKSEKPPAKK